MPSLEPSLFDLEVTNDFLEVNDALMKRVLCVDLSFSFLADLVQFALKLLSNLILLLETLF